MTLGCRIEAELPQDWRCFELTDPSDPLSTWLVSRGARFALLRPGDDVLPMAIFGGVFLFDLGVAGDVLYSALDADGHAVALGEAAGVPIVAHLRREPPGGARQVPTMLVTYFVCAPGGCAVIAFVAPEFGDVRRVVGEVARVISGVRVVHSAAGCPV
ncbi:MAG TPA: hypothetical protein VGJ59_06940 [Jatrophihabitantaceae bacterium]